MVRSESLDSLRRSAASCVRVHAAVAQVTVRRVCVRVLYTRQVARYDSGSTERPPHV